MSRRTPISPRSLRWRATAALVACGAVAAACGADDGVIEKSDATTTTRAPSSSTSTTTTVAETTTTTAAPTTTTVDPVATTTAPAAPPTVPSEPGTPPTVPSQPMDPNAPAPPVVRPPAAWVGLGLPQPGSMFENLREDHSLDGKGQFVALTFDDGPSQYTQQIVDILRFFGVSATFFQIEQQSMARPDLVRSMLAAGMHIGSHSKHHPHLRELTPEIKRDEVIGSSDELNATFGEGTVKCFRPPYAQYDQQVLDMVASRQLATAMWSVDSEDWKKPAWQSLVNRLVPGVRDRDVLLFHDGGGDRTQTIAALPWVIQGLRNRGFQFIAVC